MENSELGNFLYFDKNGGKFLTFKKEIQTRIFSSKEVVESNTS